MYSAFIEENFEFSIFGTEHLMTLFVIYSTIAVVIWFARQLDSKRQDALANYVARIMSITVIVWTSLEVYTDNFSLLNDLPFLICNLMALLMPIYTKKKSYFIFEILYFWILSGTFHAMITPDLPNGIPHYGYFKFWIVHGGLIFILFYSIFIYKYRPYWKSLWKGLAALLTYCVIMTIINSLIGSNYFYLNEKPGVDTFLDVFGDWPFYVLGILGILVPYFALIYSPYWIMDLIKKKRK